MKNCPFCIFRMLPSISKITPELPTIFWKMPIWIVIWKFGAGGVLRSYLKRYSLSVASLPLFKVEFIVTLVLIANFWYPIDILYRYPIIWILFCQVCWRTCLNILCSKSQFTIIVYECFMFVLWMQSSKCQFQSSATFLTLLLLFVFIENISIMVLTWSQYKNVSKEELIQELTDKNSSFVNNINAKLTNLSEKFNKFRSKYEKVYSELQQWKAVMAGNDTF